MAREYTEAQLIQIKEIGLEAFLKNENADYEKVSEGRKSKPSADAATKKKLTKGKGVFYVSGEGRVGGDVFDLAELSDALDAKLSAKGLDADLRKAAYLADGTYYVSASSREVCMRSMEKQGLAISKKDLTNVVGLPGVRTRFNSFSNKHPKYYASGSHLTDGGGPRIQGPSGGPGSCKFVIIQR